MTLGDGREWKRLETPQIILEEQRFDSGKIAIGFFLTTIRNTVVKKEVRVQG